MLRIDIRGILLYLTDFENSLDIGNVMRHSLIVSLLTGILGSLAGINGLAATAAPLPAHEQAIADVILGEMAIEENQLDQAHDYYLAATQLSHDPNSAKRTTYLALAAGQATMALDAAKQWATLAPKDNEAQLIYIDLLLKTNQATAALPYLQRVLAVASHDTLNTIIGELEQLPVDTQQKMLAAIMALPASQQAEPKLLLITSQLQFQIGQPEQADKTIDMVLVKQPAWPQAIALKADYLIHLNQLDNALQFARDQSARFPNQPMIQLIYVEILIKANQQKLAISKLQTLTNYPETRGVALITLAQLAIQQKDEISAQRYLQQATADPVQANAAYYLLGQIYQLEHKPELAIKAYTQVTDGTYYLTSQLKAAMLMSSLNQDQDALQLLSNVNVDNMDQAKQVILLQVELLLKTKQAPLAMQVLNKAIAAIPDDIELLYARSMVANEMDDNVQCEKDLKQILVLDPNQTTALNALGYLLINTPTRYQEALSYTQRALTLAPQNPAVLDTMGWLQYHMGNYQSAYHY
ncbi:MAG: hypothetical protein ACK4PR_03595, partial [Gammaproteobacteria bacterium]